MTEDIAQVIRSQMMNLRQVRHAPALIGGEPTFKEPVYITRPQVPDERLFYERLSSILESRRFTNNGESVRELEARLATRLGVGFCATFCNGTVALQAALRALDLSGEVITTPFTFPATVHAIEWNGLTPVFCDIDPETYNIDVAQAAELISDRTCALLPVHVFGNPCDVLAIQELASAWELRVVYDAAPAYGVHCLGQPIGCWGDLSMFSFHATKIFHTSEGGAVVGADNSYFEKLALLRNFGIVNEEEVRGVGVNGKLSEIHAAMGLALLEPTENELRARARLADYYHQRLSAIQGLAFQRIAPQTVLNHSHFTLEIDESSFGLSRNAVHAALRAENIMTRKYFSPLCSENESYRHLPSAEPDRLPNAYQLASRILCLPLYGELTVDDVDRIVDSLIAVQAAAPQIRRTLG